MNINSLLKSENSSKVSDAIEPMCFQLPELRPSDVCLPSEKTLSQEVCQLGEFIKAQASGANRQPDTDIGFSLKQQVVAVSLKTLCPDAFQLVSPILKQSGVDDIIIHLIPEHDYNGFAAYNRFNGSFVIGINSRLLDDFNAKQLAYVVGHECGHVMLKHPKLLHSMANLAVPKNHILQLKYPALSRRQEIAADRVGRICCGDLATSLATIKQTALQAKADKLEAGMHKQQVYMFFDEEFDGYAPWLQSHPSMVIRAKALIAFEPITQKIGRVEPVNAEDLIVINGQCEELTATMDHDSQKSVEVRKKYGLAVTTMEQHFVSLTEQADRPRSLLSKKAAVDWLIIKASPGRRLRILDYLVSKTCGCSNKAGLQTRLVRLAEELGVVSVFQKRLAEQRCKYEIVLAQINLGENS